VEYRHQSDTVRFIIFEDRRVLSLGQFLRQILAMYVAPTGHKIQHIVRKQVEPVLEFPLSTSPDQHASPPEYDADGRGSSDHCGNGERRGMERLTIVSHRVQ